MGRPGHRDVNIFVCSVGQNVKAEERMSIASHLWAAGLSVEMDYAGAMSLEMVQESCKVSTSADHGDRAYKVENQTT